MDRRARRNAFRYCTLRDEQFALYDAYAKRHGMLVSTLLVVNAVFYAKEGITQRDIAAQTFQSKQTVNLIVKKLLAAEHVVVERAEGDGREKLVALTAAGRERYEREIRHITWAEDKAMSLLAPDEQERLVDLQRRFTKNLTELIEREPLGYRDEEE
ncbi:MarR family winged helix-turn-helix transcriptional regulator [Propionibacterium australiense]|uniref:MarR family transcriptional regulator n=1 Tax=Propionibacterium australiense TaxID=119981 RepID=A0A383SB16_9ACTN|nr:MarR family transcriptional regulator [Propionibacterium australiense]RLP06594.1 MarR family transcriptional regulator [Propionibacterium australiense]RLP10760.1 MarR family transcriptional regulator [Propionibacterium australiense]SYZ34416.1 MarR-type HTH domain signature [Propionibacterium australiense]VEH89849.1 MarR family [Propionibacterium australiense]